MTNKYAILISFVLLNYLVTAQNWTLKLSSNVELKTWKLGSRAEKEEKALGGASIKLFNGSSLVNEITSKPNGDFTIDVPANGEYMLEVSYPGCNTKRFAISTNNASGPDNFKPSFGISGFIMARPLPGIDYSGLKNPLLKVAFQEGSQKFDNDEEITNRGLKTVSKIAEAENALVEKFSELNKAGDAALSKNDCPLAKSNYEKAIALIPGEPYPANQLVKVGDCFKQKEAEKQKENDKKDADKKAVEDAVAKAAADKAARERAESDKLMMATAQAAQKKEKEEKAAESKKTPETKKTEPTAEKPIVNSTPTPTTNNSVIKIKPKSEAELKKEAKQAKQREGLAKSQAEDREAMQKDYEKAEEKRLKQRHEEAERAQKERDGLAADKAKTEAEDKAEAAKLEERRIKEKEGKAAAEAKIIEEDKAEAAKREERRIKEKEGKAAAEAKIIEEDKAEAAKREERRIKEKEAKAAAEAKTIAEDKAEAAKKTEARLKREAEEEKQRKEELAERRKESENAKLEEGDYKTPQPIGVNKYKEVITRADDYYKTKRYGEAKKLYEEALILKPNDAHATQRIADINKMTQTK